MSVNNTNVNSPNFLMEELVKADGSVDGRSVQENFRRLIDFYNQGRGLGSFVPLTLTFSSSVIGFQVAHNLPYTPTDAFLTRMTGQGALSYKYNLFNAQTITMDVIVTSGPLTVKMVIGSF